MADDEAQPSERSEHGLDWLNFFVADIQTSFGPFVALYLVTQGWTQGRIGLVLTVGGLAAIASQIPGGALVDAARSKRLLVGGAIAVIALAALAFAFAPSFPVVLAAEIANGSTGGIIGPAMAAIALGLAGHRGLSTRLGRNRRYASLGSALTAGVMGLLGQFVSVRAPFVAAAALCPPALVALGRIHGGEIDHVRACASVPGQGGRRRPVRLRDLARNPRLLTFAGCLVLFQFTSASLMPLVSERLAQRHQTASELVTAALVIVPQVIGALVAPLVARRADSWGRKPLLLLGFALPPLRALLFVVVPSPWLLLPIQALDGLTAATIGILTPLVIADVTRGTGRYNLAQGAVGIASGLGASLSTTASGYVVQAFGYAAGLCGLAGVGLAGLGLLWWRMPETRQDAFAGSASVQDTGASPGKGPTRHAAAALPADR